MAIDFTVKKDFTRDLKQNKFTKKVLHRIHWQLKYSLNCSNNLNFIGTMILACISMIIYIGSTRFFPLKNRLLTKHFFINIGGKFVNFSFDNEEITKINDTQHNC